MSSLAATSSSEQTAPPASKRRDLLGLVVWLGMLVLLFISLGAVVPVLRGFAVELNLSLSRFEQFVLSLSEWNGTFVELSHPLFALGAGAALRARRGRLSREQRGVLRLLVFLGGLGALVLAVSIAPGLHDVRSELTRVLGLFLFAEAVTASVAAHIVLEDPVRAWVFRAAIWLSFAIMATIPVAWGSILDNLLEGIR